jgi:methoxymalonate biosynthesis acyl carrier protein
VRLTAADLLQEIGELFATRLGLEVPAPDTDLFEAGVLDSMSFVELLLQLENRCGIRLDLSAINLDEFRSLEKISKFVAARMTAGRASEIPAQAA